MRSPSKKCNKSGTDTAGVESKVKNVSDSSKFKGLSAAFAKNDTSEQSTVSSREIETDFEDF